MEQSEIAANIRRGLEQTLDTPIVPVGGLFLGAVLGSLHIATQLLDVISAERRDIVIKLSSGEEIEIGNFLLLANAALDLAGEKLQVPESVRNG